MKDEHRKFNRCIFCSVEMISAKGEAQRTAEHLLGRAIAKSLPKSNHWETTYPTNPNKVKGGSEFRWLTSRSVCKKCNETWLGEQNEKAIPLILQLIRGKPCCLDEIASENIGRYLAKIGIIADVETSNLDLNMSPSKLNEYALDFGILRTFEPSLSMLDRAELKLGKISKKIAIYVGRHDGALGINPDFTVVHLPDYTTIQKRIVFVVGKMAVVLELGTHNPSPKPNYSLISHPAPAGFDFPHKGTVTYDRHFSEFQQSISIRWLRYCLSDRKFRRRSERLLRNGERIEMPEIPDWFVRLCMQRAQQS